MLEIVELSKGSNFQSNNKNTLGNLKDVVIESVDKLIERKNQKDIPFANSNILVRSKTTYCGQRRGIIIEKPKENEAIYTSGAGPCSIVIINDENRMGIAHVDNSITSEEIIEFLLKFKNPDIKIISGFKEVVGKILYGIRKIGKEGCISFISIERSEISNAGILFNQGIFKVVYGFNDKLEPSPEEKQRMTEVLLLQASRGIGLEIDII